MKGRSHTSTPVGLPLDPQTKWSVLHNCLQHHHLMRNTCTFLAFPERNSLWYGSTVIMFGRTQPREHPLCISQ